MMPWRAWQHGPMTSSSIEYQLEPVLAFVQERVPGLKRRDHMVGMGWRKNGDLIAGVIFENIGRHNAWVHVAGSPGAHWLNRRAVRVPFIYAFRVCSLSRLTGYIEASNLASRRFAEHLGFQPEAVLTGAAEDGGDVVIYVLWAKGCRYVDSF